RRSPASRPRRRRPRGATRVAIMPLARSVAYTHRVTPERRPGVTLAVVIVVGWGLDGRLGRLVISTGASGPGVVPTSLGPAPVDATIQQARHHRAAAAGVGGDRKSVGEGKSLQY